MVFISEDKTEVFSKAELPKTAKSKTKLKRELCGGIKTKSKVSVTK